MNLERLGRVEYLLDLLWQRFGGGGGSAPSVLASPFTFVTGSALVAAGASKIGVTSSTGTVTLTLPALAGLPNLWTLIVVAQGATNPIVIAPPSGTIWDPSTSAFASTATLSNGAGGDTGWWQFDKPNSRFIEIV